MMIGKLAFACALSLAVSSANSYPLDGYPDTGIRRVEGSKRANEGKAQGGKQPPGALLTTAEVDLRLTGYKQMELPAPDSVFTAKVVDLLGDQAGAYGIAVLDVTNPAQPLYAEHRGDYHQNVGSVGKVVVATAFFQALADAWPDTAKRAQVLKNTIVTADEFVNFDHHTVRFFDPATNVLTRRVLRPGDQGSLWEWFDWMLSVSSNSAAAMMMRESMLLRQFGQQYPPAGSGSHDFFNTTKSADLTALYARTFSDPISRNGLDPENLRQGSFFTATGQRKVQGTGNSYGTARELMKLALRMEQGKLVDEWSSRQFKRLLYMTERRIRYASSPALSDAAVYFKSGSLYSCAPEAGFHCAPYAGNVRNYMNSVAIVESPASPRKLHYIVVIVSNVLRHNSAVEHQTMGTKIQRLIESMHPAGN